MTFSTSQHVRWRQGLKLRDVAGEAFEWNRIYVLEVRKNRPDAIFVKTTYISEFREVVLKRRESRRFSKLILSPTPYHCETIRLRSPKPNTRIWWRYAQDLIMWYVIVTISGFLKSFLIEML